MHFLMSIFIWHDNWILKGGKFILMTDKVRTLYLNAGLGAGMVSPVQSSLSHDGSSPPLSGITAGTDRFIQG